MIYPPITYPATFSDRDRIKYEQIINNIAYQYEKQLGDTKDYSVEIGQPIKGDIADDFPTNNIVLALPPSPDRFDLQIQSSLIAHELAHQWLRNYYNNKGKEYNNLVHYAANTGTYIEKIRCFFLAWSIPYVVIEFFNLNALLQDSHEIMQKCATQQGYPNSYW